MDRRMAIKVLSLSAASAAVVGGDLRVWHPKTKAEPPAMALNPGVYADGIAPWPGLMTRDPNAGALSLS